MSEPAGCNMRGTCSTEDCERPIRARGLCACCYNRALKKGELPPSAGRWPNRTLEERFWGKVEKTDGCWLWSAGRDSGGYGSFYLNGRDTKAHRVSYELLVGPIPSGMDIDHRCFNRGCVNPAHLRAVTRKQNIENHQGPFRNSRSGVRGVYRKSNGRWCAEVRHNGTRTHVGYFEELAQAESAVLAARRELHSHNDVDRTDEGGI